jgi:hypothetical protein
MQLMLAVFLFTVGHILAWLQLNCRFFIEWFEGKYLLPLFLFGTPASLVGMYAFKLVYAHHGSWGARFIGFAASFLVWPVLNHVFLGESVFEMKTIICVFLSCLIMYVQFKL